MFPYLVPLLVLLLFVLLLGVLSLLRREPLSARPAAEVLAAGGGVILFCWLLRLRLDPVLLFVLIYLVAMRARLVIEVANALAHRGQLRQASRLYDLASRLAPDTPTHLTVLANQGAALVLAQHLPEAVAVLQQALTQPGLGAKSEAACRYNLGLAYIRQGERDLGQAQLQQVADLLPGSPFARQAGRALEALRSKAREATPPELPM